MSGDPEVLPLLIRGVGARLDVATRETRLQGMRVGEAVAALSGQELRFAELDAERREEEEEDPSGSRHPGRRADASPAKAGGVQEVQAAGGVAASAASALGEKHKNGGEGREGRGLGRSVGVSITGGGGDYV